VTDDRSPEATASSDDALARIIRDVLPVDCTDDDIRAAIRAAVTDDDLDVVILDGRPVEGLRETRSDDGVVVYTPTGALPGSKVFVLRNGAELRAERLVFDAPVEVKGKSISGSLRALVAAGMVSTVGMGDVVEPWARVLAQRPSAGRGTFHRMVPGSGYRDDAVQRAEAKRQRRAAKRSAETARLRRLYEEAHEDVGMVNTLSRPNVVGWMREGMQYMRWRVETYKRAVRTNLCYRVAGDQLAGLISFLYEVDAKETTWETAYIKLVQESRDRTTPASNPIGSPAPEDLPAAVTSPE
jgi:hypothetical protein